MTDDRLPPSLESELYKIDGLKSIGNYEFGRVTFYCGGLCNFSLSDIFNCIKDAGYDLSEYDNMGGVALIMYCTNVTMGDFDMDVTVWINPDIFEEKDND